MKCVNCQCDIPKGTRGMPRRWCSKECRYAFTREHVLEKYQNSKGKLNGRAWKIVYRTCPECRCLFVGTTRRKRVLCGKPECAVADQKRKFTCNNQCNCKHCGESFVGTSHNATFCSKYCLDSHYRSARIARKRLVATEFVSVKVLHERDGGRCQICRKAVDITLAWPHRKCATIDHIVPLSKGGADTYQNTQLAHLSCNSGKSNRMEGKQLLLIG